jgi:hypothetical protein
LAFAEPVASLARVQRITLVAAFLLAAFLSTATARQQVRVYFDTPCICKNNHGEDRWEAKTEWSAVPRQASQPPLDTLAAQFAPQGNQAEQSDFTPAEFISVWGISHRARPAVGSIRMVRPFLSQAQ